MTNNDKNVRLQLGRLLDNELLSMDFVKAVAGDRPLTAAEEAFRKKQEETRGAAFYTDLLFAITYQYFPKEASPALWENILAHKYDVSAKVGRNIGIVVAALDYLSNIADRLDKPKVISGRKMAHIAEVALKDGLTRLYVASAFRDKLDRELLRYKRHGSPVSLIMLDIDDFKQINDRDGHPAGDAALSEIGRIIMASSRELDICARYGGEEFALILPQTQLDEGFVVAERLRASIADAFTKTQRITVSLGVANCPFNARGSEDLVKQADQALYRAKAAGKNRVYVAPFSGE